MKEHPDNFQKKRALAVVTVLSALALAILADQPAPQVQYHIGIVDANGDHWTEVASLSSTPLDDAHLTWSPDGNYLAYSYPSDSGGQTAIWDSVTAESKVLIEAADFRDIDVAEFADLSWSPNGESIAFRADSGRASNLYVANISGTGLRQLVNHSGGHGIAWSPDGAQIALGEDGYFSIVNRHSGEVRRVSIGEYEIVSVDWSPSGGQIAIVERLDDPETPRTDYGYSTSIVSIVDGSVEVIGSSQVIAWSPDGSQVAFAEGDHVMVYDLQREQRLSEVQFAGAISPRCISWLAGTGQIAFTSGAGSRRLYSGNLETGALYLIFDVGSVLDCPAWSPDSKLVALETRILE